MSSSRTSTPILLGIIFVLFSMGINGADVGLPNLITANRVGLILLLFAVLRVNNRLTIPRYGIQISTIILLITLWGLVSVLFAPNQNFISIVPILELIILALTVLLISKLAIGLNQFDMGIFFKTIATCGVTITTLTFIWLLSSIGLTNITNGFLIRSVLDNISSVGLNRYMTGLFSINIISFASILGVIKQRGLFLDIVNAGLFLLLTILSGSRQTFIAIVLYMFLMVLFKTVVNRKLMTGFSKQKGKTIIILCILICFTMGLIIDNKLNAVDWFEKRYITTTLDQFAEGSIRSQVYLSGVKIIKEYPLFGVGPGAFTMYSYQNYYPHNGYIGLAASFGVLPCLIVIMFFSFIVLQGLIKRSYAARKGMLDVYTIVISFIITYIIVFVNFNDLLTNNELWLMIVLLVAITLPTVKKS